MNGKAVSSIGKVSLSSKPSNSHDNGLKVSKNGSLEDSLASCKHGLIKSMIIAAYGIKPTLKRERDC